VLGRLASDDERRVRVSAADNTATPSASLVELSFDGDFTIAHRAARTLSFLAGSGVLSAGEVSAVAAWPANVADVSWFAS
jgi:hypothetical protein